MTEFFLQHYLLFTSLFSLHVLFSFTPLPLRVLFLSHFSPCYPFSCFWLSVSTMNCQFPTTILFPSSLPRPLPPHPLPLLHPSSVSIFLHLYIFIFIFTFISVSTSLSHNLQVPYITTLSISSSSFSLHYHPISLHHHLISLHHNLSVVLPYLPPLPRLCACCQFQRLPIISQVYNIFHPL